MKRQLIQSALLCALFASLMSGTLAQSTNSLSAGIYGGLTLNMHRGVLTTREGVIDCGTFENATGLRWFAGNQLNVPLSDVLAFSPRIYYHKASAVFETENSVQPLIALPDGSTTRLRTNHTLDVALDYVTADLFAKYFLQNSIYLTGGLSVGVATRNAFEQSESIIAPTGATFTDGTTSHRITAGPFSDASGNVASNSLRIAAVAGVGMMIPLTPSLILNPEVTFQYSFMNVISDADWKVHALRAGAGILYVLGRAPEVPVVAPPPAPTPPPFIQPIAAAVAALDVHNVDAGAELNYAELTVHNHRTLDILPLLPYVFFDAASSNLIQRYHSLDAASTSGFDENSLANDQLAVYHDLLNIVGSRLKRYPESTITLTGCLDPADDAKASSISTSRAAAVRDYLTKTWGIDASRIHVQARSLPEYVSTRSIADGRSENRRVEIASDDDHILAPVFVRNARRTIEPSVLRLIPTVQYQGKISSTVCSLVDAAGRTIVTKSANENGAVDFTTSSIDAQQLKTAQSIMATVEVKTDSGTTVRNARTIPVRHTFTSSRSNSETVRDTLVERYSMILFNFDRASTISASNEQVMRLVRSRVRTSSTVHIEGMTDYIGATANNQVLSEARATAVRNDIVSRIKPESISMKGLGEVDLFDNTIPEGRFYNRRVLVHIETPLTPELDDEGGSR